MTLLILLISALLIYYLFIYKDYTKSNFFSTKNKTCPNCKNVVEENFNVCPICKETLKKTCESCGEKVDASWLYCPYCEKPMRKSE